MSEILLVRHGESAANVSGIWQGRGESELTEAGQAQAARLAARLAGLDARIYVSPLGRAQATAAALGRPFETLEGLAEIDLGEWDGRTFEQVEEEFTEGLTAVRAGEDIPFGRTGERFIEFSERVWSAIELIFDRIETDQAGDEQTAIAVTHGGVVDAVMARLVGWRAHSRTYSHPANTSITRLAYRRGRTRLVSYNDTYHLEARPKSVDQRIAAGEPVLALIRHGRTADNAAGRIQGRGGGGLDDVGHAQADALAARLGPQALAFTSRLQRAFATASRLTGDPVAWEGLEEMAFGDWEGLTGAEARGLSPDLYERIYTGAEDLPRGGSGETWSGMEERVWAAIGRLPTEPGTVTPVVTHGGPIRAVVARLGGEGWKAAGRIDAPDNTAVTHIALTDEGPVMIDYATTGHLE
ncbi:MAG TPA: histidine phosphatase family protein [Acidimicrobiia bacterium]